MKKEVKAVVAALLIGIIVGGVLGWMLNNKKLEHQSGSMKVEIVSRDTATSNDTYKAPTLVAEATTGHKEYRVPVKRASISEQQPTATADSGDTSLPYNIYKDSASVSLPVVQRRYEDSTYTAWVSGPVDPKLDSIKVYHKTITIREREFRTKPPARWGIGVTAGYGYGKNGLTPWIGVGISYSLIKF